MSVITKVHTINREHIAQTNIYIYTQRHVNNVWNGMVTSTPCLIFLFAPYFVGFLSMNHVCCHPRHGAICKLHHSILLQPILDGCLFLKTMLEYS